MHLHRPTIPGMLQPGLTASITRTVADGDTAPALGSGDVPVLATRRLIAWCEAATVAAVEGHIGDGETTVGTRVEIDHLAATTVGKPVDATATLSVIEGRALEFRVVVVSGGRTLAEGTVRRAVVDRSRFLGAITS